MHSNQNACQLLAHPTGPQYGPLHTPETSLHGAEGSSRPPLYPKSHQGCAQRGLLKHSLTCSRAFHGYHGLEQSPGMQEDAPFGVRGCSGSVTLAVSPGWRYHPPPHTLVHTHTHTRRAGCIPAPPPLRSSATGRAGAAFSRCRRQRGSAPGTSAPSPAAAPAMPR